MTSLLTKKAQFLSLHLQFFSKTLVTQEEKDMTLATSHLKEEYPLVPLPAVCCVCVRTCACRSSPLFHSLGCRPGLPGATCSTGDCDSNLCCCRLHTGLLVNLARAHWDWLTALS